MPFLLIFDDSSMACWQLVSVCSFPWWCRTTTFVAAVVSVSVLPVGPGAPAEAALCDQNRLSCSVECVAPAPGVVLSFIDRIFDIPEDGAVGSPLPLVEDCNLLACIFRTLGCRTRAAVEVTQAKAHGTGSLIACGAVREED